MWPKDAMYSNLSRDMLNHDLRSLSPVSIKEHIFCYWHFLIIFKSLYFLKWCPILPNFSFDIETGDRLGNSWFSISRDRFEYTVSLGHTYSYPRSPSCATNPNFTEGDQLRNPQMVFKTAYFTLGCNFCTLNFMSATIKLNINRAKY